MTNQCANGIQPHQTRQHLLCQRAGPTSDRYGRDDLRLHPGIVASDIWRGLPEPIARQIKRFMLTVEEGAAISLYCATSPDVAAETGLYYDGSKVVPSSPLSNDAQRARSLWNASERWVKTAG